RDIHLSILPQVQKAGGSRLAGLNVLELSVYRGKAGPSILRGLRQSIAADAAIASALVERGRALPSIAFVAEAEFVQQAWRDHAGPRRTIKARPALHVTDVPGGV